MPNEVLQPLADPSSLPEVFPQMSHEVDAMKWYACHTRARAEKKVDQLLGDSGIPSYLPLLQQRRHWSDRKKTVRFPLFPGYVFARFALHQTSEVVRTPGLVGVVRMDGHPVPVRERELESIRAMVEGANVLGIEPTSSPYFVEGQEVEVVGGPLRGVTGILIEARKETRLIVRVKAMRQAVSIEVGRRFVRPIPCSKATERLAGVACRA